MLDSTQILLIFAAESEHLVTCSIFLPIAVKQDLQHRLTDAFSSDSFSDAAKAWNDERSLVVQEAIEKHLLPAGAKWLREYLREEVEDSLSRRCAIELYQVRHRSVAPLTLKANFVTLEDKFRPLLPAKFRRRADTIHTCRVVGQRGPQEGRDQYGLCR